MAKILIVFFLGVVLTSSVYADEAQQRAQQLAKLKSQTQQKEAELKKYREQEKKLSQEMDDLQHKKAQAERLKNKVELDLSVVEQNLVSIEDKRGALERSMPMWRGLTWQEVNRYYIEPDCDFCAQSDQLETTIFLFRG